MRNMATHLFLLFLFVASLPFQGYSAEPTYPISADVQTTRQRTVRPVLLPDSTKVLTIAEVDQYRPNGYSSWTWGNPVDYGPLLPLPDAGLLAPDVSAPALFQPAETLLMFFTMSDIHIVDKESPAQSINAALAPGTGFGNTNTSAYSPIMLSTTHVLDAAVQTINALHRDPTRTPFDFGMSLGDDANNNEYNELRWFIDVMDGKKITPSSGAHRGAKTIDYQMPYQAAGLDRSIPWYQTIGNHDQYWCGTLLFDDYARRILVGNTVLDIGLVGTPPFPTFDGRGTYMGVIDGNTEYGTIPLSSYGDATTKPPPIIAPDPKRYALSTETSTSLNWMKQFFNTTSQPKGHGFTQSNIDNDFASYTFEPKANLPLKVIVLDDTCKASPFAADSAYARACLDQTRYDWLVNELDRGQAEGKLMIITAHIPVGPRSNVPDNPVKKGGTPNSQRLPLFLSQYCPEGYKTCDPADLDYYIPRRPYTVVNDAMLIKKLTTYPNLLLWLAGHRHINPVTPHASPDPVNHPEFGFWEVETSSLRDFPQQFRTFKIVRNDNNTISMFITDVDPAVQEDPVVPPASPAAKSRGYAIGANRIAAGGIIPVTDANPPIAFTDTTPHVHNAELIKPLPAPYTLTVVVTGSGSGSVMSTPYSGVNCTAGICRATYLPGTQLTLVATPTAGSAIAGWTPSAGTSTFSVSMNGDVDVAAIFTRDPTLVVTPDYKSFGTVKIGKKGVATFTVRNTATKGVADLIIGSIVTTETANPAQFTLVAGKDRCSGQTITPGKSCTFQVAFMPTSAYTKTATVTIPSNDPDTPNTIQLTGVGK